MTTHEQITHIDLPPDQMVRQFAATLAFEGQVALQMLDIGCGTGRNARYLAQLGHTVFGINNNQAELREAEQLERAANVAAPSVYINADVRNLPQFGQKFDGVILSEILHFFSKGESTAMLQQAQELVRPGGFHVVSGYVADGTERLPINRARCLQPQELLKTYPESQWSISHYDTIRHSAVRKNGKEIIYSRDRLIVQKRPIVRK